MALEQKNRKKEDYESILSKDNYELLEWLEEEFSIDIPKNLDSIEQMELAETLLSRFGSQIVYLDYLYSYSKIKLRELRKEKVEKVIIDEYIDKKDTIEKALDGVKALQSAVSRMVTTRQEINKELFQPTVYRKK